MSERGAPDRHQRIGAVNNAQVGRDFEDVARSVLAAQGLHLSPNFAVMIGHATKKAHRFDLGSDDPPVLVECKSYAWTESGKSPSAKLRSLNEAILHFTLAPSGSRKILMLEHHRHDRRHESLAAHYLRTQGHLVPVDVEIWELDTQTRTAARLSAEGVSLAKSATKGIAQMPNDKPSTEDFRRAIAARLVAAEQRGANHVDINSGDLHRELGGYPGPKASMPSCCNAMYNEQHASDVILSQPPKGKGASLTIRYFLPREKP